MTRIWLILGDTALDEMFLALLCQHFLQADSHSQRCFFHNINSWQNMSQYPFSSLIGWRWTEVKNQVSLSIFVKTSFGIFGHDDDHHHGHHCGHHHCQYHHHDHHQIAVMGFILLSGLAKLVFHRAHWLSSRVILIIMIILMMMRMMQILGTLSFLQGNNND